MNYKNTFIAFKKTVLAVALTHLVLLLIYALSTKQFIYLNIANILDLQLYFKNLEYSPIVAIVSFIPVLILFIYYLKK